MNEEDALPEDELDVFKEALEESADSPSEEEAAAQEAATAFIYDLFGLEADESGEVTAESAEQAVTNLFSGIKTLFKSITSEDEEDVAAASQQMANLQATLEKHDIQAESNLADLPGELNQSFITTKQEIMRENSADFQDLATQIEQSAKKISDALRAFADDVPADDDTPETDSLTEEESPEI